ncbi:MAG: DUF5658 family protein [Acidobacteria bacterium]|jgi:hypothetical protein|nr:DUF5658 family protein [Acidobacteriota bacterium]
MTDALKIRLWNFTYLQCLDLLTTLAFLAQGVQEGNPLVRFAMESFNPVVGLAFVKVVAMVMAGYCWYTQRERTLARINMFFAFIVAWNLLAMIMNAGAKA